MCSTIVNISLCYEYLNVKISRLGLAQVGLKPKKCHDQEVPGDEDIQGYEDLDLDMDSVTINNTKKGIKVKGLLA